MLLHKMFIKDKPVVIKNGHILASLTYKVKYSSEDAAAWIGGFSLAYNKSKKEFRLLHPTRKYTDAEGVLQYEEYFVATKTIMASMLDQAVKEFKKLYKPKKANPNPPVKTDIAPSKPDVDTPDDFDLEF